MTDATIKGDTNLLGPQYNPDDEFKAAARRHQSRYRSEVLKVGYSEYGNRLTESDARRLLNYYEGMGVRQAVKGYATRRDGDMLRSEHIPFNMFTPLASRPDLLRSVMLACFGVHLEGPIRFEIEWAPEPKKDYLGDRTSFDVYVSGLGSAAERVGIGIEVKYTEQSYKPLKSELERVDDPDSTYWATTRSSGLFLADGRDALPTDILRQIWRNHLLGLSMIGKSLDRFHSVTLHPAGNTYIQTAVELYRQRLVESARHTVVGCTFERFVNALGSDPGIQPWKTYLTERYIMSPDEEALMQRTAAR